MADDRKMGVCKGVCKDVSVRVCKSCYQCQSISHSFQAMAAHRKMGACVCVRVRVCVSV